MPKTPGFSRDNVNNSMGFLDQIIEWTNAGVNTYDDVLFNSVTTTTDVTIGGNLTVNGNTTVISTQIVEIEDNIIILNSEETGAGIALGSAGIEIERGSLPNFQAIFQESSGLYKIGEVGSLQAVATREDSPLDKGVIVYDELLGRFNSVTTLELPITFSAGVNSVSSTTGTVIVTGGGGIGVTGDIYTDSRIFIKGNTYGNYFDANLSDELIANSATNFVFQQPSTSEIKVPVDVYLTFDTSSTKIFNDGTDLNIQNTVGDINFTTEADGSIRIPINTYLEWDVNNRIRYNNTDIVLDSSGDFIINPPVTSTDTTPSVSGITGAIKISGGIGISNTTDSTSSTNGGTLTTDGGAAIRKTLFIGDRLEVGDQELTFTQVATQGVNFLSKDRTLVTSSTDDTTFNSFGVGTINLTTGTIDTASTVYIAGSPSVSGGGTLSNSYSLWVDEGDCRLDGLLKSTNTTATSSSTTGAITTDGGIGISNTTAATSSSIGGTITTAGGAGIAKNLIVGENINIGDTGIIVTQVAGQGTNIRSRNRTINTISSTDLVVNSFEGASIITGATIGSAATVYISDAPSIAGGSITNNYALWVNNGNCRLDGDVFFNSTTPSTSPSTGSLVLQGGLGINIATDASNEDNGGSLTTAGGVAIKKKLFTGGEITSNIGTGNEYYRLFNTGLSRFTMGLAANETGGNSGSNFTISRYNDAGNVLDTVMSIERASGDISYLVATPSTTPTSGSIKVAGGIGLSNTTNASSNTNGGTFTTAGGAAIAKDLYIGGNNFVTGNFDVNGATTLDQTTIDTTDGQFSVLGTNGIDMTVGDTSTLRTTSGSIIVDSEAGTLSLDGNSGVTIDSNSSISVDASGASNFTTTVGDLTLSGIGLNLLGGTAEIDLTTTGVIDINSGSGGVTIDTTDTVNGIKIGEGVSSVPVTIGHSSSEVIIGDNLTISGNLTVLGTTTSIESTVTTIVDNALVVNALPTGLSDGGYLIRRYQTPNDTGIGVVVSEMVKETGSFQVGSSTPDTLILDASASIVDDFYTGWWIKITSGAGLNQVRRIKTYTGATRTATIYITSENDGTFQDGLDLTIAPSSGDTYNLYDCAYAGMYLSEAENEIRFACLPFDINTGVFPEPSSYISLHVGGLTIEESLTLNGVFTNNGQVIIDHTDPEAFLVRKDGDTGDVFTVDSSGGNVLIANPVNTVSSDVTLSFQQLDSVSSIQTYSQINSTLQDNLAGNLRSDLDFKVQKSISGLVSYLTLKGDTSGFADFSTDVDAVRVLNSTASTSNITGSLRLSGGLGISNVTNSVSETNGGSITTAGGAAIAKKLFVGGQIDSVSTSQLGNTVNNVTGVEGSLNTQGDLTLYNATKNTIIYREVGSSAPSFTARSDGSKIVLLPNTTASTTDYAIGIEPTAIWYSTSETTNSHKFYLATTEIARVDNSGIQIRQDGDGIGFFNGADTARIYQNSSSLRFIPHDNTVNEGIVFRDASDTTDTVRINNDGQVKLGLSDYIGTPGTSGSYFDVGSVTFTDNVTLSSTTASTMRFNTFQQSTLAASNTLVTTTDAINTFIGGAPIKGTNQGITNAYGLYIDQGASLSSTGTITTASSLYIKGAPTGTNITNPYAFFVDDGESRFDGKLSITDTEEATVSGTGAIRITGGASVEKSLVIGTDTGSVLGLNFDQRYDFSGNVSGNLNLQSKTAATGAKLRQFTNDGDNTDSNLVEIYGLGTPSSTVDSEFVSLGYEPTSYSLKTQATGTGVVRSLNLETGANSNQVQLLTTGQVSLSSTTSSTSNSSGALLLSGGIGISDTTNASSSTNGGTITTAGGAAIAQDVYIGGDLYITGAVEAGVTSPTLTQSNNVNITGGVTISVNKLISNGNERFLSVIFRMTPTSDQSLTSFEFTVPGITSFVNVWDLVSCVNGFRNDADPINLENTVGFAVTSTNRAKVSFTSSGTDTHTIQYIARYTV